MIRKALRWLLPISLPLIAAISSAQTILPMCTVNATCLFFYTPGVNVGANGIVFPDGSVMYTAGGGASNTVTSSFTITGAGGLLVTGPVMASTYYGDGSNLTGVTATESNTFTSSKTFTTSVAIATQSGSLGVGTSSPSTKLSVFGIITSSSPAPSISCNAGSGTLTSYSNSSSGRFVAGSGAKTCTITFVTTWPHDPSCFCNDETTNSHVRSVATSTALVCDVPVSFSGDTITYGCLGAQ